jgi:hypothetical protein
MLFSSEFIFGNTVMAAVSMANCTPQISTRFHRNTVISEIGLKGAEGQSLPPHYGLILVLCARQCRITH